MPWLLDGNNLAGGRDRLGVREAALALARRERVRLLVVFDGPPPAGVAAVELLGSVEVRYAGNADAAILEAIEAAGDGWVLATDDRNLARRARALGARCVGCEAFWRRVEAARERDREGERPGTGAKVEAEFFDNPANRLPASPKRVIRRRASKRHQGRR